MARKYEFIAGGPWSITHKQFIAGGSIRETIANSIEDPTERSEFWRGMFYDALERLEHPDEFLPDGMEPVMGIVVEREGILIDPLTNQPLD